MTEKALGDLVGSLPAGHGLDVTLRALRTDCLGPLWAATTEIDLDLREEPAAEVLARAGVELLTRLHGIDGDFATFMGEAAERALAQLPGLVKRIADESGVQAARVFERAWRVLWDVGAAIAPRLADIPPGELPADASELASTAWDDPVFRDLMLLQTYVFAVASAAERPGPLPALTVAMCSRAYRGLTSYLRLAALVDPCESGLVRPGYRPLRHAAYRAAETNAVRSRFDADAGKRLRERLEAARKRTPELID